MAEKTTKNFIFLVALNAVDFSTDFSLPAQPFYTRKASSLSTYRVIKMFFIRAVFLLLDDYVIGGSVCPLLLPSAYCGGVLEFPGKCILLKIGNILIHNDN